MLSFRYLALLAAMANSVFSQAAPAGIEEELEDPSTSSPLLVSVDASFPSADIFGIKAINGVPLDISISIKNSEPEAINLQFIGGSLWTPNTVSSSQSQILRNLTTKQYGISIPAGESETVPYAFTTNMHPQDVRLNLAAVMSKGNQFYTQQAYNGTISVAEPNSSIFDPQIIFLYLFILALLAGGCYVLYTVWIAPYFPQKKRVGGPAKSQVKKIDAGADRPENDGPASSTGAQKYAEEWIPSHHLQRPEAKRVKSGGRPKSRQA